MVPIERARARERPRHSVTREVSEAQSAGLGRDYGRKKGLLVGTLLRATQGFGASPSADPLVATSQNSSRPAAKTSLARKSNTWAVSPGSRPIESRVT